MSRFFTPDELAAETDRLETLNAAARRLEAAAPALLAVARAWDRHAWLEHDCFGPDGEDGCLLCATRAAIRAATGGTT